MSINQKLALITGASGGIGEAFAQLLAEEGYSLILVARKEDELNRVRGVINGKHPVPITVISADLTEYRACDALGEELTSRGAVPTLVINNAGFGLAGQAANLDRETQLNMVDLNVRVLTYLTLRYLPQMVANRRGGIINVASVAAFMPGPNMAVYFATKAYVVALTDAVAEEVRDSNVTVMSLCPGPVDTGFQARAGMKPAKSLSAVKPHSAAEVAAAGWAGFKRGDRMVIPGAVNKLTAYATRGAPRSVILPFIRRAMAGSKA